MEVGEDMAAERVATLPGSLMFFTDNEPYQSLEKHKPDNNGRLNDFGKQRLAREPICVPESKAATPMFRTTVTPTAPMR